jgi:hypothetical protein
MALANVYHVKLNLMLLIPISTFFDSEVQKADKLKMATQACRPLTELPQLLQQYFLYCGYTGKECARSVSIEWQNTMLRFSAGSEWKPITCTQVNVLPVPLRLVYIKAKLFKFIPFEAVDECLNGKGLMLIKLFKLFTISRTSGKKMDKSALVTILAETMLIPAYALQHYITWHSVGPLCLKGTINYKGISASGLFYFAPTGQMLRFETDDRYYTAKNGKLLQMKWIASIKAYSQTPVGEKIPSAFSAMWDTPQGEYEYFKGSIAAINYTPFVTYNVDAKVIRRPRISLRSLVFPAVQS